MGREPVLEEKNESAPEETEAGSGDGRGVEMKHPQEVWLEVRLPAPKHLSPVRLHIMSFLEKEKEVQNCIDFSR